MEAELIETISAKVHDAWMKTKLDRGINSQLDKTTQEELLVPYEALSEDQAEARAYASRIVDRLQDIGAVEENEQVRLNNVQVVAEELLEIFGEEE